MFIKPHLLFKCMILKPQYSYEFNTILNEDFNEMDQIQNFASLLSDKDRFLGLVPQIQDNQELLEKRIGSQLPESIEFYVVRAEKFKSFSLPITIEYSLCPEEMIVFLLKEIIKTTMNVRFPDEILQEEYINSCVKSIVGNGTWNVNLDKFLQNLDDHSKKVYPTYEIKEIDFTNKNLKEHVEELYEQ